MHLVGPLVVRDNWFCMFLDGKQESTFGIQSLAKNVPRPSSRSASKLCVVETKKEGASSTMDSGTVAFQARLLDSYSRSSRFKSSSLRLSQPPPPPPPFLGCGECLPVTCRAMDSMESKCVFPSSHLPPRTRTS